MMLRGLALTRITCMAKPQLAGSNVKDVYRYVQRDMYQKRKIASSRKIVLRESTIRCILHLYASKILLAIAHLHTDTFAYSCPKNGASY